MPAIKLDRFAGELPAWDPKLLPDGQSQRSVNGYLFSGTLEGWRVPTLLRAMDNPNANYVYRIPVTTFDSNGNAIYDPSILGNSNWLEYIDPDTTVVRSQVINDQFQRYYEASPTQGPPQYNTLSRIQLGQSFFQLGIPQPAAAPVVSVSGGGNLATLGPTTSVGGGAAVQANTVYLLPIVTAGAAIIESVTFVPLATNPGVHVQAVVYADAAVGGSAATVPGVLLGATPVTTGIAGGTPTTLSFTNPIAISANTPYWIGIMMDQTETIALGDGVNGSSYFVNSFSSGPSAYAGVTVPSQPDLQMYASLVTSSVFEARTYVYTYISAYGEEGPPSAPTLLNGWSNGTWTIKPTQPPANYFGGSGLGNIAILRIYRTVVSSQGGAVYFQVQDISVNSSDPDAVNAVADDPLGCIPYVATFTDIFPDNTVALNLVLGSTNFFPPPTNLQQIFVMPNGMYVGYTGNQVWFSQPYLPHAWPPGYVFSVDAPIVGMAITLGCLVVVTNGVPWVIQGTNPSSLTETRCSFPEPCRPTERGSIVGTDIGVFYKTINGLMQVTSSGQMGNYTQTWVTRDKWNAETPANYTRAIPYLGQWFAFGTVSPPNVSPQDTSQAQIGCTVELDTDSMSFTIWPQPGGHRVGFGQLQSPLGMNINNVQLDPWTGIGLLITNGQVYYYDFTNTQPALQTYDWTSKVYQQNTKRSYEAFKVWFTNPFNLPVPGLRNTTLASDPSWQALPAGAWLYVLVYADVDDGSGDGGMQLVTAREIQRSGELMRIQDGFKADNWQVRFIGQVPVSNMQMATSAKELANV